MAARIQITTVGFIFASPSLKVPHQQQCSYKTKDTQDHEDAKPAASYQWLGVHFAVSFLP